MASLLNFAASTVMSIIQTMDEPFLMSSSDEIF
jgi:hypothetical protein